MDLSTGYPQAVDYFFRTVNRVVSRRGKLSTGLEAHLNRYGVWGCVPGGVAKVGDGLVW